ncbi:MAG TPA: IniB N-terminal domain-containing protein [Pseudonocardiaceae bacterium]
MRRLLVEQAAQATPQVQAVEASHVQAAPQTLHDFVLNLISDPQALTSFEQDPAAMLDHAGLNQISAADVQEVMPLVIDFVPAHAEALDSVLSQLPLDSVDTGQLGAIQQLQFVTQALGGIPSLGSLPSLPSLGSLSSLSGMPSLDAATTMGNGDMGVTSHVNTNSGAAFGVAGVNTPLGAGGGSVSGDLQNGVHSVMWSASPAGTMHADMQIPGLSAVPSLGGGLPSGFSALSDVTDALDGHLSSVTGSMTEATNAANLVAGALANPADLAGALADPAAAVSALTGTAQSMTSALPAPANAIAGSAMQSATSATHGVVSEVTSHLPAAPAIGGLGNMANVGNLGNLVGGHLPALDPTQALSTVQGVVGDVTGNLGSQLPTGALGSLGHLDPSAATHALSTVQGVVGNVASHSAVTDVTGAGTGSPLGALDHVDVGSELSHVTSELHLPLF